MPVTESFLAFIDTETGGLIPGKDPVIEVACILTDLKLEEIARFNERIQLRVGEKVSPEAAAKNGYDPAVWAKEAVHFSAFETFLQREIPFGHVAIPVGHNVSFDREMIDVGYYKPARRFCPLGYRKIDTVGLAMAMKLAGLINPPDLKLESVAKALGIKHENAHRAMPDLLVSKEVFERSIGLMRRAPMDKIAS